MNLRSSRLRKVGVGIIAVSFLIGAIALLTRTREPVYHGEPLSYWVLFCDGEDEGVPLTQGRRTEMEQAIRTIGTNAIPFLLEWMDWKPNALQKFVKSHEMDMPHWMRDLAVFRSINAHYERHEKSHYPFYVLGPIAAPAVSELSKRIRPGNSFRTINRAYFSLAAIGKSAVPTFLSAIEDPTLDFEVYATITDQLWHMRDGREDLAPALLKKLSHTNESIVAETLNFFSRITNVIEPIDILPTATNKLNHSNIMIRRAAVEAIGVYGDATLISLLTNALSDSNSGVRKEAQEAIVGLSAPSER